MDTLFRDLRFAFRTLRHSPGFTAVAVLTLALGIGATTTIFSVVNAVLLRPLPYRDADRLVVLWETIRREDVQRRSVSYPNFEDWRAQAQSVELMSMFGTVGPVVTGGCAAAAAATCEPERRAGEIGSADYFALLGVRAALGRTLGADDDHPGADRVIAISDALWRRRFGADPSLVGRAVTIDGAPAVVVGVMPPTFRGIADDRDVWLPIANPVAGTAAALRQRSSRSNQVVARLRSGSTQAGAQAELDAIARRLEAAYPQNNAGRGIEVVAMADELFGDVRRGLLVLMGAVGFVLLIACANVANLLLARAAGRTREMALRSALGATRVRLVRQLIAEGVVLALAGGAAGALLAVWGVELLAALNPVQLPSFVRPRVDGAALLATLGAAALTGVVFGLVPAAVLSDARLGETLKESARGSTGGRGALRARVTLVVAQTAVALVLLAGAGLLVRSLARVNAFDPGFRADELVGARLALPEQKYSPLRAVETGLAIAEQLRAVPGVRSVALASDTPMDGSSSATLVRIEGRSDATQEGAIRIYRHRVSPGFFATLGTPLVSGRDFTHQDADTGGALINQGPTGVVIISQSMARRFWPGGDPVGKRLLLGETPATIVGVVGDVKHRQLLEGANADPDVYFALRQLPTTRFSLVVRAGCPQSGECAPEAIIASIRREVQAADRDVPVFGVSTMRERLRDQTAQARFTTTLLSAFAALALLLAAIGLYGVMAYSVSQRTQEIGIRMALGAARGSVIRLIVWQGARVALAGVAIGIPAALAATRVLRGALVGVQPNDPATLTAVAALLAAVALVAAYVPARRAARVDPVRALRSE